MTEPLPENTYTITGLHQTSQAALRERFGTQTWVVGEISSKRTTANGMTYIELVEKNERTKQLRGQLKVVVLRTDLQSIRAACAAARITITEGVEVRIRGRVTTYPGSSALQLQMDAIDAEWTLGRLAADKDELRRRLTDEGVLAANKRHTVPLVPLQVALVTSIGSAAYEDFLDELRRSGYAWQVMTFDARVQGDRGPDSVSAALDHISSRPYRTWNPDVVALIRGGGSRSDLVTFDHEKVIRAVGRSPYPIITGIGHEIDSSLADEAALAHFKTPTAAAQGLVGRVRRYVENLDVLRTRVVHNSGREIERAVERLDHHTRAAARSTEGQLHRASDTLTTNHERIERASGHQLTRLDEHLTDIRETLDEVHNRFGHELQHLDTAERVLAGYDPAKLLERGWAIVRHNGNLVTAATDVTTGDVLDVQLGNGTVEATVTHTTAPPTSSSPTTPSPIMLSSTTSLTTIQEENTDD